MDKSGREERGGDMMGRNGGGELEGRQGEEETGSEKERTRGEDEMRRGIGRKGK